MQSRLSIYCGLYWSAIGCRGRSTIATGNNLSTQRGELHDDDNTEVDLDATKYQIRCDKQYRFNAIPKSSGVSYTECLKLCSGNPTCKTVDYWDPKGGKHCYLFTVGAGEEPAYKSDMCWAAFKV